MEKASIRAFGKHFALDPNHTYFTSCEACEMESLVMVEPKYHAIIDVPGARVPSPMDVRRCPNCGSVATINRGLDVLQEQITEEDVGVWQTFQIRGT